MAMAILLKDLMSKALVRHQLQPISTTFAMCMGRHIANSSPYHTLAGSSCSLSQSGSKYRLCSRSFRFFMHNHQFGLQSQRPFNSYDFFLSTLNQSMLMFYRSKCIQTLLSQPKCFFGGKNIGHCHGACNRKYRSSSTVPTQNKSKAHEGKSLVNRFLFVRTLNNFYDDVPDGIVMDTAYADSRPNEGFDKSLPVVVGLHDTPGDHKDLLPFLEFFAKLGCRTVCPTFPGHGQTKGVMHGHDDVFCQSTLERAAFVSDFLNNLDIERVDVLVGVGASCYTSMALCTLEPQVFKTTALISPWPMSQPRMSFDANLLKHIKGAWDTHFFRLPLRLLLSAVELGNAKTVQEKITLAYLLANLDFGEVQSHGLTLRWKNRPYIVAYGERDYEIDQSLYDEMMDTLGIVPKSVTKFNGVLKNISIPGALVFPDGDYHILTKQRGVLCASLLKLLQTLHPSIEV